jgi:hypothetical protein
MTIGKNGGFVPIFRGQDLIAAPLEDFLESLARAGVFFEKENCCSAVRRTRQRVQF